MNIVKWIFPDFEEWEKNSCNAECSLGDYNCRISIFSWGQDEATYQCAISTASNPINIYSPKIFSFSKTLKYNDKYSLRHWYYHAIEDVQTKWEEYVRKTYLQE